jgi:serine/threonine protein kinase
MAAVWAGANERTGKRVALKVILRSMATTSEAQHLFHSEALAASRVNHPNVVTVFDVIDHDGMTCIVMELLDGEPLGSYIAHRGFLSLSEATNLLLPAMRGVAAANAQGVIHRDLKPQNIFVCIGPDGRVVTTKVLDFGISVMMERVINPSAGPVLGLTMGTPAYMSPEHLSGAARIDERTDVYGFGLLLYEALTGQMPFPGEPGPELFERVLNALPPPLSKLRPELPPALIRIVEVAIAKDPDHRYSDLNLMVSAIEDELLPPTPLPHLITPIIGVPAQAFRDALSGHSVVNASAGKNPSGPHQETKMLFTFPLEKGNSAPNGRTTDGSNGVSTPDPSERAPSRPTSRETVVLRFRPPLRKVLLRLRSLSALRARIPFDLRRRRELAGAGIAIVLVAAVWMVVRGSGHVRTGAPAAVAKAAGSVNPAAALPAPPTPVAAVILAAEPPTFAVSPSPSAPGQLTAREQIKLTNQAGALAVSVVPGRTAGALEISKNSRRHVRGVAERAQPARTPGASARAAAPRAGSLSEDDF